MLPRLDRTAARHVPKLPVALRRTGLALLVGGFLAAPSPAAGQGLPCRPCAGLAVADPGPVVTALRQARPLADGAFLTVAWPEELDGSASRTPAMGELAALGVTPWVALTFRTPAPVVEHADLLRRELEEAARLARGAPKGSFFQVLWRPREGDAGDMKSYAFLLKRAAVAISGASPDARVATTPLPPDSGVLEALYGEDVAAYLDALCLDPGGTAGAGPDEARIRAAIETVNRLDPGRNVVVDALPAPGEPLRALPAAARMAVDGAALTLFRSPEPQATALVPPLLLLADELAGDVSYDPYSTPTGGTAWSFVRGRDLGLRVIAEAPPDEEQGELALRFSDPQLRDPARVDPASGETVPLAGVERSRDGLVVRVADPGPALILHLERPAAAELGGVAGVAEEVTVEGARQMPVEEILRRLQAFEDAQERRIEHYSATNTTHLRFLAGTGNQTFEATLQGPTFVRRGGETDWAWQSFYVNGVKWKWGDIPEIPLVQPEKAAALPLEIHFTREYRYRLRGTDKVDGRDTWVVDFEPASGKTGGKLYRGTVWVDRQTYARVRTRAVQLGLEGDVISNEETLDYEPVDAQGQPSAWSPESFILPLHRKAEQILSVINSATVVELATELTDVRINQPGFEARREKVLGSKVTMVRDTPKGLRYLVKDPKSGERVVKQGYDTTKVFLAGGVFYDDSLAYPLPLAGVNYLSLDFKGTGAQLNTFFAGALLTVNAALPRVGKSRFDLGGDVFGIAVPLTDTLFRANQEVTAEEVKQRPASVAFKVGRPLGSFVKLRGEYRLRYSHFSRTKNTADDFILPDDTLTQSFTLGTKVSRGGYTLAAEGSWNQRSKWDFWGLPGNTEFDPAARSYNLWKGSFSKTWFLRKFRRAGFEVDYVGGSDLDRFSKYSFGFFGDTRVHGYQSNRVRAERAWLGHLTYGIGVGESLHLDAVADFALATDRVAGLRDELLGGVGLSGTFLGPWKTLVNLDVGTPVAGPDSGFVAYIVFLKLFK